MTRFTLKSIFELLHAGNLDTINDSLVKPKSFPIWLFLISIRHFFGGSGVQYVQY